VEAGERSSEDERQRSFGDPIDGHVGHEDRPGREIELTAEEWTALDFVDSLETAAIHNCRIAEDAHSARSAEADRPARVTGKADVQRTDRKCQPGDAETVSHEHERVVPFVRVDETGADDSNGIS